MSRINALTTPAVQPLGVTPLDAGRPTSNTGGLQQLDGVLRDVAAFSGQVRGEFAQARQRRAAELRAVAADRDAEIKATEAFYRQEARSTQPVVDRLIEAGEIAIPEGLDVSDPDQMRGWAQGVVREYVVREGELDDPELDSAAFTQASEQMVPDIVRKALEYQDAAMERAREEDLSLFTELVASDPSRLQEVGGAVQELYGEFVGPDDFRERAGLAIAHRAAELGDRDLYQRAGDVLGIGTDNAVGREEYEGLFGSMLRMEDEVVETRRSDANERLDKLLVQVQSGEATLRQVRDVAANIYERDGDAGWYIRAQERINGFESTRSQSSNAETMKWVRERVRDAWVGELVEQSVAGVFPIGSLAGDISFMIGDGELGRAVIRDGNLVLADGEASFPVRELVQRATDRQFAVIDAATANPEARLQAKVDWVTRNKIPTVDVWKAQMDKGEQSFGLNDEPPEFAINGLRLYVQLRREDDLLPGRQVSGASQLFYETAYTLIEKGGRDERTALKAARRAVSPANIAVERPRFPRDDNPIPRWMRPMETRILDVAHALKRSGQMDDDQSIQAAIKMVESQVQRVGDNAVSVRGLDSGTARNIESVSKYAIKRYVAQHRGNDYREKDLAIFSSIDGHSWYIGEKDTGIEVDDSPLLDRHEMARIDQMRQATAMELGTKQPLFYRVRVEGGWSDRPVTGPVQLPDREVWRLNPKAVTESVEAQANRAYGPRAAAQAKATAGAAEVFAGYGTARAIEGGVSLAARLAKLKAIADSVMGRNEAESAQ